MRDSRTYTVLLVTLALLLLAAIAARAVIRSRSARGAASVDVILSEGTNPQFYSVDSHAQLEMELERNQRLGHDMFKAYIRLPDEYQKRVVEFAHKAGMQVTSHDIFPGVTFGLDGAEHVGGGNRRGYQKVSAVGRTYGDVIQLLARSGMVFDPTLSDDMSNGFDLAAVEDPAL